MSDTEYVVVSVSEDGKTLRIKPSGAPDSEAFEVDSGECEPIEGAEQVNLA